ncbi:MAG: hypothetical protein IJS54_03700 [Desulfovibrio sp.]|nr:hypothetical protein [Desulfovibrio sp.]
MGRFEQFFDGEAGAMSKKLSQGKGQFFPKKFAERRGAKALRLAWASRDGWFSARCLARSFGRMGEKTRLALGVQTLQGRLVRFLNKNWQQKSVSWKQQEKT